ncbi:MAG: hypothetical protein HZB51_19965 [Chloroflexi bacterium]|nr:hypothetical protein [Chloroflexota bacterium]
MGFLKSLKSMFTASSDPNVLWLYVKCKRCESPVAVRVDLRNDPSLDDESDGYILRKEIMDDKCFTLMHAQVKLNARHAVTEKTIDKGEFITEQEFLVMRNTQMSK